MAVEPGLGGRSRHPAEAIALAVGLAGLAVAAHARAYPGLIGHLRDDGEYAAFAHALATGLGYVDPSDPGLPPARRYPLGFPALIALALAGAPTGADQLARLAWLAPAMLAAFAAATYVALRALGGFGPLAALAATAIIAAAPRVLDFGAALHADTPFAMLGLATLIAAEAAWRRGMAPRAWLAIGMLAGGACLVRYAGAALVVALALGLAGARRGRAGAALGLGLTSILGPWLAWRAFAGGENYASTVGEMMPEDLAAWPARVALACGHVAAAGVPGHFLAPAAWPAIGPWLVPGLAVTALVARGAWTWLRDPGTAPFAPLYVAATLGLTAAFHAGYVHYMPDLPTRLLLPVAPLLWIAAARGLAEVARRSGWGPGAVRRLLGGAVVACGLALALSHVPQPGGDVRAHRAAIARRHHALFAAVAREVPADSRVLSQFPAMLWLYTGRRGHPITSTPVDGRLTPLAPLAFLMVLEHWRIGHVVVMPDLATELAAAVPAFQAAFPGVLEARWVADGAGVYRVAPGPFAAACDRHRIRAINDMFERLGR